MNYPEPAVYVAPDRFKVSLVSLKLKIIHGTPVRLQGHLGA